MPQIIVDVVSISSAAGLRFDGTAIRPAVLALVTYFDTDYPNLGPNKRIIALSDIEYSYDLIGTEITKSMTSTLDATGE